MPASSPWRISVSLPPPAQAAAVRAPAQVSAQPVAERPVHCFLESRQSVFHQFVEGDIPAGRPRSRSLRRSRGRRRCWRRSDFRNLHCLRGLRTLLLRLRGNGDVRLRFLLLRHHARKRVCQHLVEIIALLGHIFFGSGCWGFVIFEQFAEDFIRCELFDAAVAANAEDLLDFAEKLGFGVRLRKDVGSAHSLGI